MIGSPTDNQTITFLQVFELVYDDVRKIKEEKLDA